MKKKLSAVMLFVLGALAMVVFQQVGQTAPALTALDYAEIQQLYTRYAIAADTNNFDLWARVFTKDGVIETTNRPGGEPYSASDERWRQQGHDELKAWNTANDDASPLKTPQHYIVNMLIEPTADGAMGAAYFVNVRTAYEADDPAIRPDLLAKGVYHDQLVQTPEGWRFKRRTITWGTFPDELLGELAQ